MTSAFDSEVYALRRQAGMASICLHSILRMLTLPGYRFRLSGTWRPSVASRRWYELEWWGPEDKDTDPPHIVRAQDMHLLCWRAARRIAQIEERGANGLPSSST